MLSQVDILSLVADQLPAQDKARTVCAIAAEHMLNALMDVDVRVHHLKNPFCKDPFVVRTMFVERDGRPVLVSTLLDDADKGTPRIVAVMEKLPNGDVAPLLDPAFREVLGEFPQMVFDAFVELMERSTAPKTEQEADVPTP